MRKSTRYNVLVYFLIALTLITGFMASSCAGKATSRIEALKVESAALADNLLGDPGVAELSVYLPAEYAKNRKARFPVIYYLHGFDETPFLVKTGAAIFDRAIAKGSIPPSIIVEVPGRNSLGGSFYVDSPVTGGWETFTVSEVPAALGKAYRTMAERQGRALMGFSMGGFAALNLAMRHPDRYIAVFAVGPGALIDSELNIAMNSWDTRFQTAYGAAFAPDPSKERPYARIPRLDSNPADKEIQALWLSGFGDFSGKISAYASKPDKLAAIGIAASPHDQYGWIYRGSKAYTDALKASGFPVHYIEYPNGHTFPNALLENEALSFLGKELGK